MNRCVLNLVLLSAAAGGILTAAEKGRSAQLGSSPVRNAAATTENRWTYSPLLGYLADRDGLDITPILGIPGATVLGSPVGLPDTATRVHLPPGQRYALVQLSGPEGESVAAVELTGGLAGAAVGVNGIGGALDRVRFSPSGSCAALSPAGSEDIVLLANLPYAPAVSRTVRGLSGSDEEVQLLVSDDCAAAAVVHVDGAVQLLSSEGPARVLYQADAVPAAAFVPGASDLLLFDSAQGTLHLLPNAAGQGTTALIAAGLSGFAPGESLLAAVDRRTAVLGVPGQNVVRTFDLVSGAASEFWLAVPVRSFERLRGDGMYLLSGDSSGPAFLGRLTGTEARGFRIPARPARRDTEE